MSRTREWQTCCICKAKRRQNKLIRYVQDSIVRGRVTGQLVWYFCPKCYLKLRADQPPSKSTLPLHRTGANTGIACSTCDGGGCPDCTDPA